MQESEQVQMSLPFTESEVAALQESREEALQAAATERTSRRPRTVKQGRRAAANETPCRLGSELRLISGIHRACKLVPTEVQKKMLDYDELATDEVRDVSERLEFDGSHFVLTRYQHPRFLRSDAGDDAYYITCRLPECTMGNSAVGDTLLVHSVCNKFIDRLPLYRQLKFFSDSGLVGVNEPMLSHWLQITADVLRPLYDFFLTQLYEGAELQIYEVPTADIRDKRPIGHMAATRSAADGRVHYRWSDELPVVMPGREQVLEQPPVQRDPLFIAAPGEGELSAIFYTFIDECDRCGVVFGEWLLATLQNLPGARGRLGDLLPAQYSGSLNDASVI